MSTTELYPPDFRASPIKVERSKRARRRYATMPTGVQPIVRLVFSELSRQGLHYQDIEDASGVGRVALKSWRCRTRPSWESLQSVLSVLGFGFVPTPVLQVLRPEMAGEITALAMKLGADIPTTWAALIDIGVEQKLLRMDAAERRAVIEAHHAALHPSQGRAAKAANDNQRDQSAVA